MLAIIAIHTLIIYGDTYENSPNDLRRCAGARD
jgi:hypothetical protein